MTMLLLINAKSILKNSNCIQDVDTDQKLTCNMDSFGNAG